MSAGSDSNWSCCCGRDACQAAFADVTAHPARASPGASELLLSTLRLLRCDNQRCFDLHHTGHWSPCRCSTVSRSTEIYVQGPLVDWRGFREILDRDHLHNSPSVPSHVLKSATPRQVILFYTDPRDGNQVPARFRKASRRSQRPHQRKRKTDSNRQKSLGLEDGRRLYVE